MNGGAIFSPRQLIGWALAALATFALTFWLMATGHGGGGGVEAIGPSAFSRSAIGYSALADLLRRLDVPIEKSRDAGVITHHANDLVVIAEPRNSAELEAGRARLISGRDTLYILPKWIGLEDPAHPGWLEKAAPLSVESANWVFKIIDIDATALRVDKMPTLPPTVLDVTPTIDGSVQLVASKILQPIIGTADGMLLGHATIRHREIWVLSDPDVLSNFGLSQGDNAVLAKLLFDMMRHETGAVIFDETVHGFTAPTVGALKLFVTWPYVIGTLQGLLAIGLLAWATMGRFGRPQPLAGPLTAGKVGLVANAARLITFAGHQDVMARRYVETVVQFVGRRLHAPAALSFPELIDWLANAAAARRVTVDTKSAIETAFSAASHPQHDAREYLLAIKALHVWKQELLYGRSDHPRGR